MMTLKHTHTRNGIIEPSLKDILEMCALFESGQIWHHHQFPEIFCPPENTGEIISYFKRYFPTEKSILRPRSFLFKQTKFTLGWFKEDKLKAYVLYSLYKGSDVFFGNDIWFAHIDDIAVDENYRKNGIAAGFLSILTEKIDALGGGIMSAQVWDQNISSEKLFEKAGFEGNCKQFHRVT